MAAAWTTQQVLELAPDAASAKAGQGLANRSKWGILERSEIAVWGEISGSGKNPYQVRIDLREPAFKCSCPSRKFPCKHSLALFLIFADQGEKFTQSEPPGWVADWLTQREARKEGKVARAKEKREVDPKAQARRMAKREEKVRAGIEELSLWLSDLLHQGLGIAQTRPLSFWNGMAARLVDAQATGLARLVRQLGEIASSGDGWQTRMLAAIGRLHLIVSAYRRLDALPPESQADARTAVGWAVSKEDLLKLPRNEDRWSVLAQRIEQEDQLRVQRTWLCGRQSGQMALVIQFAAGTGGFETTFSVGTEIDAAMAYYPSAIPLRAMLIERKDQTESLRRLPGATSVDEALAQYAGALAKLPWLERWPMRLAAVTPVPCRHNGAVGWRLRDADGRQLPLDPRYQLGWSLLAVSGGSPMDVFGEWDGETLIPLSACSQNQFYAELRADEHPVLSRIS